MAGSSSALRRELLERRLRGQNVERNVIAEIPRVSRAQPLRMSYGQERFWFLDHLQPGSVEYLVPLVLRVRGTLDAQALGRALQEVVARHEVLRTRYVERGGSPVQVIDAPAPLELACVDLRALAPEERERRLAELAVEEGRKPIDLAAGPVLRAQLVRLSPEEDALLVMMHHIATDGWSMGVLTRELDVLYQAFASGRASPLPALSLQYADFAAWQRERLAGEVLRRQLDYWKKRLAGVEPLELATDRPRPSVRNPAGGMVSVEIRGEVGSKLV
ncbi:MAG TPA: condensation domain-containing protein, partial [Myxococcaceae bacterium]|nr:condensation domain-containing protein [Myxococcaceae bacterium]